MLLDTGKSARGSLRSGERAITAREISRDLARRAAALKGALGQPLAFGAPSGIDLRSVHRSPSRCAASWHTRSCGQAARSPHINRQTYPLDGARPRDARGIQGRRPIMFWKPTLAIAALVLCCFASVRAAPPAAGDGASKHFLWRVTGSKGVVYLLGTIHVGKADFYPLPSIIEDSFKNADTLIEEVDLSEPAETTSLQRWVIERGSYPNGEAITNHLSEAT